MLDPNLIAITLGLCVGFLMALTGAGGAILSLPLLMFFLNLSMQQAAPIALLAVFTAAAFASMMGLKQGIVRYRAAGLMAIMGVIAAPIGVSLAHRVSPLLLQSLFVVVLLYVAWHMLKATLPREEICTSAAAPCEINPATSKLFWTASCTRRLILTGSIAGFLSGLIGVGGGFVVVPSLQKMSNLEHHMIVATSLTVIALVSLISVFAYAGHAQINWLIAVPFVAATFVGSLAGRGVSNKIQPQIKNGVFGGIAIVLAFAMVARLVMPIWH